MNRDRYLRLMAMASVEALISFPINLITFISKFQYAHTLQPWISWDDTHFDFGYIGQTTAAWYQETPERRKYWPALQLGRWGIVVGCYMFFAFFGTGKEALQTYSSGVHKFRSFFTRSPKTQKSPAYLPPSIIAIQEAWEVSANSKPGMADSDEDLRESKSIAEASVAAERQNPA
ncbi:hypothetical protein CF319_g2746 [Tilletia indica]|nr:hypothetical protein CF319_g2746 [Tilletia indica]